MKTGEIWKSKDTEDLYEIVRIYYGIENARESQKLLLEIFDESEKLKKESSDYWVTIKRVGSYITVDYKRIHFLQLFEKVK